MKNIVINFNIFKNFHQKKISHKMEPKVSKTKTNRNFKIKDILSFSQPKVDTEVIQNMQAYKARELISKSTDLYESPLLWPSVKGGPDAHRAAFLVQEDAHRKVSEEDNGKEELFPRRLSCKQECENNNATTRFNDSRDSQRQFQNSFKDVLSPNKVKLTDNKPKDKKSIDETNLFSTSEQNQKWSLLKESIQQQKIQQERHIQIQREMQLQFQQQQQRQKEFQLQQQELKLKQVQQQIEQGMLIQQSQKMYNNQNYQQENNMAAINQNSNLYYPPQQTQPPPQQQPLQQSLHPLMQQSSQQTQAQFQPASQVSSTQPTLQPAQHIQHSQNLQPLQSLQTQQNLRSQQNLQAQQNLRLQQNLQAQQNSQTQQNLQVQQDLQSQQNQQSQHLQTQQHIQPQNSIQGQQPIQSQQPVQPQEPVQTQQQPQMQQPSQMQMQPPIQQQTYRPPLERDGPQAIFEHFCNLAKQAQVQPLIPQHYHQNAECQDSGLNHANSAFRSSPQHHQPPQNHHLQQPTQYSQTLLSPGQSLPQVQMLMPSQNQVHYAQSSPQNGQQKSHPTRSPLRENTQHYLSNSPTYRFSVDQRAPSSPYRMPDKLENYDDASNYYMPHRSYCFSPKNIVQHMENTFGPQNNKHQNFYQNKNNPKNFYNQGNFANHSNYHSPPKPQYHPKALRESPNRKQRSSRERPVNSASPTISVSSPALCQYQDSNYYREYYYSYKQPQYLPSAIDYNYRKKSPTKVPKPDMEKKHAFENYKQFKMYGQSPKFPNQFKQQPQYVCQRKQQQQLPPQNFCTHKKMEGTKQLCFKEGVGDYKHVSSPQKHPQQRFPQHPLQHTSQHPPQHPSHHPPQHQPQHPPQHALQHPSQHASQNSLQHPPQHAPPHQPQRALYRSSQHPAQHHQPTQHMQKSLPSRRRRNNMSGNFSNNNDNDHKRGFYNKYNSEGGGSWTKHMESKRYEEKYSPVEDGDEDGDQSGNGDGDDDDEQTSIYSESQEDYVYNKEYYNFNSNNNNDNNNNKNNNNNNNLYLNNKNKNENADIECSNLEENNNNINNNNKKNNNNNNDNNNNNNNNSNNKNNNNSNNNTVLIKVKSLDKEDHNHHHKKPNVGNNTKAYENKHINKNDNNNNNRNNNNDNNKKDNNIDVECSFKNINSDDNEKSTDLSFVSVTFH